MSTPFDPLISQPQLRRLLGGVSDTTIWRWRNAGTLPEPVIHNGRNYFRTSDLQDLQSSLFAASSLVESAPQKTNHE